jgi:hypothetical protein
VRVRRGGIALTRGGRAARTARARDALDTGGLGGLAAMIGRGVAERRARYGRAVRGLARRTVEFGIRPHLLRGRVKHVHGPSAVPYGPDELLAITVVRNGALFIDSFLEHHQAIGIRHFVFLDNGSTDDTIERLCAREHVTVLETDAPYGKYENTMKRFLAERFSQGRWNLCVDIDELFDYPFSARLPLRQFLAYLDRRGFTAVVAQMLDMFSSLPLCEVRSAPGDRLKEQFPYYDTSAITASTYHWARLADPRVKTHRGGIRRAVFGTTNGLTKAALVKMDGKVRPFIEWHQAAGALVADVSCVLLHFPFVATFVDKVQDAVRTGRYGATTTDEYVAYAAALEQDPRLSLMRPTARRFEGLEPLIAEGFLVVSDEYRDWVREFEEG